ncbi:MAG: type II secretion system F family protein [Desulfobacterales bacterium]
MPIFSFKAINEQGKTISDVVEADSIEMANSIILARGYIPTGVISKGGVTPILSWFGVKERLFPIKTPELILFAKQFRTMLRSGVSMMKILQVLENQTENQILKKIIFSMSQDIKDGTSLYNAFSKHPKTFSNLFCGMVRAGEASESLPDILDRIIYILDHEHKIKSDIKSALQYPIIVISFLFLAFFILLTFVIPKFVSIFISAGLNLPIPTKICLLMYNLTINYWYLFVGGLIAIGMLLTFYLKTVQGRFIRDAFLMKLPILGPLFVKSAMSRFASIFSILQSSGVPVLESMTILSGTIGNTAISREFDKIFDQLEEGRGISKPLESAKYFTPIVINMVAVGEESGNLDEMLKEVADHYDVEMEYAMKKLTDAIGPVLTIGLAAVVGFFALAIFLPMWDLVGIVK